MPIPWSGELAPYGFGPDGGALSWLPAPATWRALSVAAQTGRPARRWSCTGRRCGSATSTRRWTATAGPAVWLESGPGVLAFHRCADDAVLTCVVNLSGAPVLIDGYGRPWWPAPTSPRRTPDTLLPMDAAAWLERR